MKGVEDKITLFVRAFMPRDKFSAAVYFDSIDIGFDQDLAVPKGDRNRVVVTSVAYQR